MQLLVSKTDIDALIANSLNSEEEKERFLQINQISDAIEGAACLQIVFENGEDIVLKGIDMKNLFFNDLKNK